MAKPKLALIPAAQGTKFYSVLPSDGVGDFTFNRGSVATRINAQGLIENVASGQSRLDYPLIDGVQKGCPHHILEPARTNLIQYSEQLNNSEWGFGNVADYIDSNSSISPDGTSNGDTFVCGASGYSSVFQTVSTLNAQLYTVSVFVKKGNQDNFSIELRGAGSTPDVIFDLKNGTIISGTDGEIKKYANGWYRCSLTKLSSSTSSIIIFGRSLSGSIGDSFQIYGAQIEQGSYPTSYIPTNGESGGVTRSAETATGAGNSTTFNSSEGVLMAEISALANDVAISLSDNTFNNSISFGVYLNKISAVIRKDGGYITSGIIDNSGHAFNNNKIAIKYNSSSCDFYVNGFVVGSSSGVAYSSNVLDNLNFNRGSANDNFYGKTKQLQYYNSALTESELEQLTSWQSFRDMANGQLYTIE